MELKIWLSSDKLTSKYDKQNKTNSMGIKKKKMGINSRTRFTAIIPVQLYVATVFHEK